MPPQDISLSPYKYKGREFRVFLTPGWLFQAFLFLDKWVQAGTRAELEKKIAHYVDHEGSIVLDHMGGITTRRKDIELAPYTYKGIEYRIFLASQDLFRVEIGDTAVYASSRAELEQRIADFAGDARPHDRQSLFFPIMRIDSNATNGFDLSRFQVMLPAKDLYSWHTCQRLSVRRTSPLPDTFPTKLAELPFIDTTERGRVYYALFEERVWHAFTKLNERLKHRFAINQDAILAELVAGHYSSSQSQMKNQLYKDYMWRPFLQK